MKITDKVQKFILAVLDGKSHADAYRGAYNATNMKNETIARRAVDLMKDSNVKALLEKMRSLAQDRGINKAADVVAEFIRIHSVDTTEIVQHRRLCCRYCYGKNHRYQWRDTDEFEEATAMYQRASNPALRSKAAIKQRAEGAPKDNGGYGYKFNQLPHPECPRCYGEGTPDVFIADWRTLTPLQRKAIAGVKQTKDGIEIKFRDQDGSLTNAGKMMGGFKQTFVFENPDGTPLNSPPALPTDPAAAAAAYAEWIKAAAKG